MPQRLFFGILCSVFSIFSGVAAAQSPTAQQVIEVFERGRALQNAGRSAEALPHLEYAAKHAPATLGADTANTASAYGNLANAYTSLRRYDDALRYFKPCLEIRQKALGADSPVVAMTMANYGDTYAQLNRFSEAEKLLLEALRIRESKLGRDHQDVGLSLINLGGLYIRQGKHSQAYQTLQRAYKIAQATLPANDPNLAATLNNLAIATRDVGKYQEAAPLFERAVQINENQFGKNSAKVAETLTNLGDVYSRLGRYSDAERIFRRSFEINEAVLGPDAAPLAGNLTTLANLNKSLGRLKEAEPQYRRALKIAEKHDPQSLDTAMCAMNLGVYLLEMQQLAQAETAIVKGLAIREAKLGKDHTDVAFALHNLGSVHLTSGRFNEAEKIMQRALAIREKAHGKDHPLTGASLTALGDIYVRTARYADAKKRYERALKIRQAKQGDSVVTGELAGLSEACRGLGDLAGAEQFGLQNLKLVEKNLPADHPRLGKAWNDLGLIYWTRRNYDSARDAYRKALPILEKKHGAAHPNVGSVLNNWAAVEHATGNYREAEAMYQRALKIRENRLGEQHPETGTSLGNLGTELVALDRFGEAGDAYQRSRKIVRRHIVRVLPGFTEREQLAYLNQLDRGQLNCALSFAVERRADAGTARLSAEWVLNGKGVVAEAMSQRAFQVFDSQNPAAAGLSRELADVRKRLAALALAKADEGDAVVQIEADKLLTREQELSKQLSAAALRSGRTDSWVTLSEVRGAVPKNAVLVEFIRFKPTQFKQVNNAARPDEFAAWIIPAEGQGKVQVISLGAAAEIETLVRRARVLLQNASQAITEQGEVQAEQTLRTALDALATKILRPLGATVEQTKTWILSPDDVLWLTPWSALPLGEKYAAETHEINYIVSGRKLAEKAPAAPPPGRPCVFADPAFSLDAATASAEARKVLQDLRPRGVEAKVPANLMSFTPLPGTAVEAKAITPNVEKLTKVAPYVYTQRSAQEGVFKAFVRPQVAVLSTHAFFREDEAPGKENSLENPLLRCGLAFAGANLYASAPADREDGILTGLEIVGLDLRGTQLVVLSACETGLGKARPGEGVAGLRQAFHSAGAKAVVSTLWQIPDQESALLMNDFFERLAAGDSKSVALSQAQRRQIETRRERYGAAHPFFWAAWTVSDEVR